MDQMKEPDFLECLQRVAAKLKRNEWKFLAVRLGLSKADVDDIARAHPGNYSRQKTEMLLLWKRNYREYATADRLVRALGEMGGKGGQKRQEDKPGSEVQQRQITPRENQSRMRDSSQSFLSSAVQIRGLPLPIQERQVSPRNLWRSGTMSFPGRYASSRQSNESRWRRAVSATPPKQGKITIEVDIQNISVPQKNLPLLRKNPEKSAVKKKVQVVELPPTIEKISSVTDASTGAEPVPKDARGVKQRRVRCRCSIHRSKDETDSDEEEVETKDPFDNLLKSLQDPFFRRLTGGSAELDTAVDQLEKMKGLFVDEAKLKCILFTCRITDIDGLERIWEEYQNGGLVAMLQTSLVTDQSLASVGACGITLAVRMCQIEYQRCKDVVLGECCKERGDERYKAKEPD
ncbi:uncharacterized protein LOC119724765 [Patiria miniata]|uniref:Death domain-containing protein n=1 Tax=Patiria miniata TaxID=46514 RepID=A0A913ZKP9_PATMI|nr:uncharacterized protein LOC119724765 [Patiria miniata]